MIAETDSEDGDTYHVKYDVSSSRPPREWILMGFMIGFCAALVMCSLSPVTEWRMIQVARAYLTLNWTHTREAGMLQEISNVFALPFTIVSDQEQAVVRHMITGLVGASIPVMAGHLPLNSALTLLPRLATPHQRPGLQGRRVRQVRDLSPDLLQGH